MNESDKLNLLLARCESGVYLTINAHRGSHETVESILSAIISNGGKEIEAQIGKEVIAKMIEKDTIIDLDIFPDTPIGSFTIYHHDLNSALDAALEYLDLTHIEVLPNISNMKCACGMGLKCLTGHSAHPNNWYCPSCDSDNF